MAFLVYLRGGPEPVGGKANNRIISVPEAAPEIEVPVDGGRQGRFSYADETINTGGIIATVFDFVEIV